MAVRKIYPNTPAYRKLVAEWERVAPHLIDSEGDVDLTALEEDMHLGAYGPEGIIRLDSEMRKIETRFLNHIYSRLNKTPEEAPAASKILTGLARPEDGLFRLDENEELVLLQLLRQQPQIAQVIEAARKRRDIVDMIKYEQSPELF